MSFMDESTKMDLVRLVETFSGFNHIWFRNKVMTECKSSARDHPPDNSDYAHIFWCIVSCIEKAVDRQRLKVRFYLLHLFQCTIARVFIDDEGEWLEVHYAMNKSLIRKTFVIIR
eukprot:504887_1